MKSNVNRISALLLMAVLALVLPACIESLCVRNADCESGQVCVEATGQCIRPECVQRDECGSDFVCEEYACVEGCTTEEECGDGETCSNYRCVEMSDCNCPSASAFCQQDINPSSPTADQEVCVAETFENGVALFFGSVWCSICRDIYHKVLELQAELEADGAELTLMFVQSPTSSANSTDVSEMLGSVDSCVVQDNEALKIWHTYNAGSYDLIIINAVGCVSQRFDRLSTSQVEGELGAEIGAAWVEASTAVCEE